MIDFMIIGLPRSATTWAANLFTTDLTLCHHDPLYTHHYTEWDTCLATAEGGKTGVSCTGIWRWADWVNAHPAKKLIIHRDLGEIQQSMRELGAPDIDLEYGEQQLKSISGMHIHHTDLFDPLTCRIAHDHLLPKCIPFNEQRHSMLLDIEMQPKFSGLTINSDVTRRLLIELSHIGGM